MKYELKSIGLWSFIKVAFVVNLVAGAIGGLFALPFGVVISAALSAATYGDPGAYYDDDGSLGAMLFILPIVISFGAAVVGTFFQFIVMLAYNLIASVLGGIELTLTPLSEPAGDHPYGLSLTPDRGKVSLPPPPPPPSAPSAMPPPPQTDVPPQVDVSPRDPIDPPALDPDREKQ